MNDMNEKCITINETDLVNFKSHKYLAEKNFKVPWDLLISMKLRFSVTTKTFKRLSPLNGPECFNFHIEINFDNDDHDGQVIFSLISTTQKLYMR